MTYEKLLILNTGRQIKLVVQESLDSMCSFPMCIEVLIKDPIDDNFHPPIGVSHPKYWKLKTLNQDRANMLQIVYSGVSDKQLKNLRKEYERKRVLEDIHVA